MCLSDLKRFPHHPMNNGAEPPPVSPIAGDLPAIARSYSVQVISHCRQIGRLHLTKRLYSFFLIDHAQRAADLVEQKCKRVEHRHCICTTGMIRYRGQEARNSDLKTGFLVSFPQKRIQDMFSVIDPAGQQSVPSKGIKRLLHREQLPIWTLHHHTNFSEAISAIERIEHAMCAEINITHQGPAVALR